MRTKFCLSGLPAPFFLFYFQAIPLLKQQQNHSLTMSQEQVSGHYFCHNHDYKQNNFVCYHLIISVVSIKCVHMWFMIQYEMI